MAPSSRKAILFFYSIGKVGLRNGLSYTIAKSCNHFDAANGDLGIRDYRSVSASLGVLKNIELADISNFPKRNRPDRLTRYESLSYGLYVGFIWYHQRSSVLKPNQFKDHQRKLQVDPRACENEARTLIKGSAVISSINRLCAQMETQLALPTIPYISNTQKAEWI